MNLGTIGTPVEITKGNALDKIVDMASLLDKSAAPRPYTMSIDLHRYLDKRQRRRMRREMGRQRGRRVRVFWTIDAKSG